MHIVLVIPTMSYGGAERVMSELANKWSENGHDVTLVLLAEGIQAYSLNKKINIIKLGFKNPGKLKRIFYELKTLFYLRKVLAQEQPDFVLSFMYKYNIFTLLASLGLKLNIYVSDRNNPKNVNLSFFMSFLRKRLYKKAKGIIAQTSLAKEIIGNETKNKNIVIIPNPLRKVQLFPKTTRENIILNIGSLHPQKGQEYLLEIFARVNLKNWKLIILGSGSLLESLKLKAVSLGIENKVEFKGSVSNVDEYLSRASIFAFTSLYEGFPNALVEAMAAKLPCISFDCETGPKDIIVNAKNGYLVPLKDISLFSSIVQQLAENEQLRISIGEEAFKVNNTLESTIIANKFLSFCSGENI